jgi:hypothetical protein
MWQKRRTGRPARRRLSPKPAFLAKADAGYDSALELEPEADAADMLVAAAVGVAAVDHQRYRHVEAMGEQREPAGPGCRFAVPAERESDGGAGARLNPARPNS